MATGGGGMLNLETTATSGFASGCCLLGHSESVKSYLPKDTPKLAADPIILLLAEKLHTCELSHGFFLSDFAI
jgi:hypothetical protein